MVQKKLEQSAGGFAILISSVQGLDNDSGSSDGEKVCEIQNTEVVMLNNIWSPGYLRYQWLIFLIPENVLAALLLELWVLLDGKQMV